MVTEQRDGGISLEKAAKVLDISTDRVVILAEQGRLKTAGKADDTRYDVESVLSMKAENLIREMHAEAGDKQPKLRAKIDTLAALQFQRGREAKQHSEHWELMERIDARVAELTEMNEAAAKRNEDMERRHQEMMAKEQGLLRRIPRTG